MGSIHREEALGLMPCQFRARPSNTPVQRTKFQSAMYVERAHTLDYGPEGREGRSAALLDMGHKGPASLGPESTGGLGWRWTGLAKLFFLIDADDTLWEKQIFIFEPRDIARFIFFSLNSSRIFLPEQVRGKCSQRLWSANALLKTTATGLKPALLHALV